MVPTATHNQISEFSFWERQSFLEGVPFLVIGSGIVGLSAALAIREREPRARILVLERGVLPQGASTRNAGFACFGSMTELLDDLNGSADPQQVWDLVAARYEGLQRLRKKLGDATLRYEGLGGYELFRPQDEASFEACLHEMEEANRQLRSITGSPYVFRTADAALCDFGFAGVTHLLHNNLEGQIDTGAMMQGLLRNARSQQIEVLTGVEVERIDPDGKAYRIYCRTGHCFQAGSIIVATNGFTKHLLPDVKLEAARNQVLITKPIGNLAVRGTFHYDRGYVYFRHVGDRVLLGGGRHLAPQAETTDVFGAQDTVRAALLDLLHSVILPGQQVEVDQWWSGILGVGDSKTPIIKTIQPGLVAAVRLGGMGVAIGNYVGERAAALALEHYK